MYCIPIGITPKCLVFDYIWRYELNWLGFKYLPIGLAPMGLAPPIRLTPIGLTALALCLLGNDISIWRIWDPIGSCDRQSQLGIIPPLIENFKYVFRSKTCCDIIYVSITYFRVEKLSSVPISILLDSGRNLKPKERDKWHKTIKIKSFMVRSDRSKARRSNDQMTHILQLFKTVQKVM